MTSNAINTAISTSTVLMSKLVSVAASRATAQNTNTLALIQNSISNQFNKKVAALQDQVQTSTISTLQQQQSSLSSQLKSYQTAEGTVAQNNALLADLTQQLATLSLAAQSGNSTTFDQALSTAQLDVNDLQSVPFAPGLLQDGAGQLPTAGLGIQSSSYYNLGTTSGQAQALSDVKAAQAKVGQVVSLSQLNQQITASAQNSLQTQLSAINTQISSLSTDQQAAIAAQSATLEQQAQNEYHIIEMNLGNDSNASSFISSIENYAYIGTTQAGTTSGLLGGASGDLLPTANITTTAVTTTSSSSSSSSTSSSGSSSSLGSLFSTTA